MSYRLRFVLDILFVDSQIFRVPNECSQSARGAAFPRLLAASKILPLLLRSFAKSAASFFRNPFPTRLTCKTCITFCQGFGQYQPRDKKQEARGCGNLYF